MRSSLGWVVLALVFVDELLAIAATAVWGAYAGGAWLALVAAGATMAVWGLFASPRAAYAGPVVRPVVKVLVFTVASALLWVAGHPGWAVALLVFSAVVNALALRPSVQALIDPSQHR